MEDTLGLDGRVTVDPKRTAYICPQCRKPGTPDPGFTRIDDRYAIGRCSGDHVGQQMLVRENVVFSPKPKRKRKKEAT